MKTIIKRSSVKAVVFAAGLLATCLLGRPANAQAQAQIQGKFTLPFEARWGKAVLPPGDYELKFSPENMNGVLAVRDAKSHQTVAFEAVNNREDGAGRGSALLIGTRGTQHVVYSLTIAELGETFVYERPSARAAEEARKTQTVPILVADK